MAVTFKDIHRLISELSPEEIKQIRKKISDADLKKIGLLNNANTIEELNSLQPGDNKASEEELSELYSFISNLLKSGKDQLQSGPIFKVVKGDNDMNKVIIGPPVESSEEAAIEDQDSLNFIYQTILEYLKEFRPSYESKIIKWLEEMEDLFNKKLFKASLYYLENAHNLAKKYEAFHFLDTILKWKKVFVNFGLEMDQTVEEIDDSILELRIKAANFWQYKILNQKITSGKGKVFAKDHQLKLYKEIENDPLLRDEKEAKSISAKIAFNEILALIFANTKKYAKTKIYWKRMIELCQENPQFIYRNIIPYINTIHNYLNICLMLEQYDEMGKGIEILDQLPKKFPYMINRIMYEDIKTKVYCHKLNLFYNSSQFYRCFKMVAEIDYFLQKTKTPIKPALKAVLLYNLASALYMYQKHEKAVQKLDQILQFEDQEISTDFKIMAHTLKMINFIDQQSYFRLDREFEEAEKYFKAKKIDSQYHNELMQMVKDIIKDKNKDKQDKIFKKYLKHFKKMNADGENYYNHSFFDIISWLQSKIEDRKFLDIVKESKAKKAS